LVVVEVDGGRLRTRAAASGPGVHDKQNKEDKIACLQTLHGRSYESDPQPQPPPAFVEPRRVQRLVQRLHGTAGEKAQQDTGQEDTAEEAETPAEEAAERTSPVARLRTCLASMVDSQAFGPMVAAEAQERDFYRAQRRAFVSDGAAYNWSIQQGYFWDFTAIADFMHVLCYLYLAAWAVGGTPTQQWAQYETWMRLCWQGRVQEVIAELRGWQDKLGEPPEGQELKADDPRRLIHEALTYLQNNAQRMDYPRYRQEGLPVTSSLVESLVGEFNARVKGREKFWNRLSPDEADAAGAEAILQVRAAVLSEDDRLERFFAQRPGNPYRRRRKAA
jgi:hypothetical protein